MFGLYRFLPSGQVLDIFLCDGEDIFFTFCYTIRHKRESCPSEKLSKFIYREAVIVSGMCSDFNIKIAISEMGFFVLWEGSGSEEMPIGHRDNSSGIEEISSFLEYPSSFLFCVEMMKRCYKDNRIKCLSERIEILHVEHLKLSIGMEPLSFCNHTGGFIDTEITS